ncbi:hypothetical protein [Modestobacter lapidis]|nr:hypothetical protein [Modestobacter lapidis]
MRPSATVLRAGLSATAAVLLLTGCGGSDEEPDAAPSAGASTPAGSTAESTATSEEDVQAFCAEAEAAFTGVADAFGSPTAPADVGAAFDQIVTAFDQVEPPAEISADWSALQQSLTGLRDAVAGTDVTTPEGQAEVQGAVTTFQNDTAEPQRAVEDFLTTNCDNAATGTPTTAPSS